MREYTVVFCVIVSNGPPGMGSCRGERKWDTHVVVVQSPSRVWLFVTPWTAAHQASLSSTNSWSLLKLMSIELVMLSNHLILCCPLLLPWIFPSIRVFSSESILHIRWPNYWSFSFNISPSNEHPRLISFRMDWLDILAVQETLKSFLQCHSSKASILQHSVSFMVQLSHDYWKKYSFEYNVKSGSVKLPALFFILMIALAIQDFCGFTSWQYLF